jgi:hypothetical protein
VATSAQSGAHNLTQLEFETTGPPHRRTRYARPVEGALLEALHNGAPVSRSSLEEQLDLAMRGDAAADGGDHGGDNQAEDAGATDDAGAADDADPAADPV